MRWQFYAHPSQSQPRVKPAEKGDGAISNSSGSADRDPAWSPDGKIQSWQRSQYHLRERMDR